MKVRTLSAIVAEKTVLEPRKVRTTRLLQFQLGVAWDEPTAPVFNAITQDVMALRNSLPENQELLVISEDSNFLKILNAFPGVVLSSDPLLVKRAELWKLYYENTVPAVPSDQPRQVYSHKVGANEKAQLVMRQTEGNYPSLYNPSDNREVPVGLSPSIQKIPPRYYSNMPYTLQQPWW